MNTELMEKTACLLESDTSKQFGVEFNMNLFSGSPKDSDASHGPECGTVCCIAGYALLASGQYKSTNDGGFVHVKTGQHRTSWYVEETARGLLGLSQGEANRLFYADNWPEEFGITDSTRWEDIEPKTAANRIRQMIATGE